MYIYTLDHKKARSAKITYPRVHHAHTFPARLPIVAQTLALPYPPIVVDHTRENFKTALVIATVVNIVSLVLMLVMR